MTNSSKQVCRLLRHVRDSSYGKSADFDRLLDRENRLDTTRMSEAESPLR